MPQPPANDWAEITAAVRGAQRINVVGASGAGKSTFSKQLAAKLGIPHLEIDAVHWRPNWEAMSHEELSARLADLLASGSWILDGNYMRIEAVKWKAVEVVLWLDYGRLRTFWRVWKRSMTRLIDRREIWPGSGNRESFHMTFLSTDSVLLWALRQYRPLSRHYSRCLQDDSLSHIRFVRLCSPRDAERLLAAL